MLLVDAETSISQDAGDIATDRNQAPVAVAGENFEIQDDDGDGFVTVTVDGSSSGDANGSIESYQWTQNGEVLSSDAIATVNLPVGTNRLTLKVTDDQGLTGKATIRIRVKRSNSPKGSDETPASAPDSPAPPYDLEAIQKFQEVALSWLVEPGIEPPYRIYRIIDDGLGEPMDKRDWKLLWEEPVQLSYRDKTGEIGVPYLYVVRTFDGSKESVNTNVASIILTSQDIDVPTEVPTRSPDYAPTDVPTEQVVPTTANTPTQPPPTVAPEEPTEVIDTTSDESTTGDGGDPSTPGA